MMDCVDAGAWHPYDDFIKLDYQALDLSHLKENSADVVTCYVGLHHFTPERLTVFLNDVRRILRLRGHFLLVDHDVCHATVNSMAHMAHVVFNAVNGVSLQDELSEVRDFKSMQSWVGILEQHDLYDETDVISVPMVRGGDPTENRMVAFSSVPQFLPVASPGSSGRVSPVSVFKSRLVEEGDANHWDYDSDEVEEGTVYNLFSRFF